MLAIVVQTFIAAPAETVWRALLSHADILLDALPGRAWPLDVSLEEPRRLACAWPAVAGTNVEMVIHDAGNGVRLDLRHMGWQDSPESENAVQGHFAGWLFGLAALGHFVESGEDPRSKQSGERYFISGEIPASADAVFAVLPRMVLHDVVDSTESRRLKWKTKSGELVGLLRPTPRGTHVALGEYGVTDRSASEIWPALFEDLTRRLS